MRTVHGVNEKMVGKDKVSGYNTITKTNSYYLNFAQNSGTLLKLAMACGKKRKVMDDISVNDCH